MDDRYLIWVTEKERDLIFRHREQAGSMADFAEARRRPLPGGVATGGESQNYGGGMEREPALGMAACKWN